MESFEECRKGAGALSLSQNTRFFAHSMANGWTEPVIDHLHHVARLARTFAADFGPFEAEIAALTHDLGKYGDLFQQRLLGRVSGIDHWSIGAWALLQRYRKLGLAAALAVQGHHIGLCRAQKSNFDSLDPAKLSSMHPLGLRLSCPDLSLLQARFFADGGHYPAPAPGTSSLFVEDVESGYNVAAMLDVRMLFSALVDADYVATEAHFQRGSDGAYAFRAPGRVLAPEQALERLHVHLQRLRLGSKADATVRAMREDLQRTCAEASSWAPGLYTLTAPTGAGKTLAMLLFALRHAREYGLRRIVVVLPFLNLIEETAEVYKAVFGHDDVQPFVIEDHSLTEIDGGDTDEYARLLAENWDAPIIVTTSVRFCESLFSNRPAACRKLHNIARSVILFDEVQTLPPHLAVVTLAALAQLRNAFGCTVVLSTATQPAFTSLDPFVARHARGGWNSVEIVPRELGLFGRIRRVRTHWPKGMSTTTMQELADMMVALPQALAIVNVKRHSRRLFELLADRCEEGLYHLSTDMCPAHRAAVLKNIKERLAEGQGAPCRVVSTQCVEAGVNLDFPTVFRAWAPLEALAQAAGRCNREGRLRHGEFHIFLPPVEEEVYPNQAYRLAASVVKKLVHERGGVVDLEDPEVFQDYYRRLYRLDSPSSGGSELLEFVQTRDFAEVANHYHLIEQGTVNVLVPYSQNIETYRRLRVEALSVGLSRDWLARARRLSVSLYKGATRSGVGDWLEPVRRRGVETGWYVYLNEHHYSDALGLVGPEVQEFLLA